MQTETLDRAGYELRFQSLSDARHALAFPCDEAGRVDMDALGVGALNNYLYARTVVGREFFRPRVTARHRGLGSGTARAGRIETNETHGTPSWSSTTWPPRPSSCRPTT
jgi:hypothetical protein